MPEVPTRPPMPSTFWSWWNQLVERFLPAEFAEAEVAERARLLVSLVLPGMLVTTGLTVLIPLTGEPWVGVAIYGTATVGLLVVLALLRGTGAVAVAAHLAMATTAFGIAATAYFRGGFAVSSVMYLAIVPVFALWVAGQAAAIGWTGLAVALTAALWGLAPHGPSPELLLFATPSARSMFDGIGVLGLTLLALSAARFFEHGRQLAKRRRKSVEARLQLVERMESVGQLAGGVAHDFNNLLTVVLGSTAVIEASLPDEDPAHEDLQEIHDAVLRAAELTRQLLVFSRREVVKPEVVQLNRLLDGMRRLLVRTLPENVDVNVAMADDLWNTIADPGQLEQVIVNLVVNARDAMPDGGQVAIATTNADLRDEALAAKEQVRPGRYVLMTVTDTGLGMTPEVMARAFDPFYTTKPQGTGTGLGLSTVYGTVRKADGYVWAASRVGGGTTINVYLPAATPSDVTAIAEPGRVIGDGRGERILLVEDDDAVRKVVRRILVSAGYAVTEVSSAIDALELARAEKSKFDLLLTDVVMPKMSGPELAEQLAAEDSRLRILFMTGYADRAIDPRRVLPGGVHIVKKPFTEADLRAAVRERLDA